MKIGSVLLCKYNGAHNYVRLVVLHDYRTGSRVLYDMDNSVVVGSIHALYAEQAAECLTRREVLELTAKAGLLKHTST